MSEGGFGHVAWLTGRSFSDQTPKNGVYIAFRFKCLGLGFRVVRV